MVLALGLVHALAPQHHARRIPSPECIKLPFLKGRNPSFVDHRDDGNVYVYNIHKPYDAIAPMIAKQMPIGWQLQEIDGGVMYSKQPMGKMLVVNVGPQRFLRDFTLAKGTLEDWTYISIAEMSFFRM